VGIVNRIQQPIQVRKSGVSNVDGSHEKVLQTGEIYWIPLLSKQESPLSIRLLNDRGAYEYSQDLRIVHPPVKDTRTQYFKCLPTSSATAPAIYGCFHAKHMISAAMSDVDQMDEDSDEQETIAAKQQGTYMNEQKSINYGSLYVVRPAATVENLTAQPVEVRIAENINGTSGNTSQIISNKQLRQYSSSRLRSDSSSTPSADDDDSNGKGSKNNNIRWDDQIKNGDEVNITTAEFSKQRPSSLSIKFSTLNTGWSSVLQVYRSDVHNKNEIHDMLVKDTNGRELYVKVDISTVQGCVRMVLYVNYWLYDMTNIGLIPSIDKKSTVPLGNVSSFTESITSDVKHPIMLDFPQNTPNKLRLCTLATAEATKSLDAIEWSQGLNIDHPGFTGTVECTSMTTIPHSGGRSKGSVEIGVKIESAPCQYHRTKLVTLTPHWIVVNQLDVDIELRQAKTYRDVGSVTVKGKQQQAFHWPVASADHVISFRRSPSSKSEFANWHWSGMFNPKDAGDIYFTVRHKIQPNMLWYPHVSLRTEGATTYIVITQFEQRASVLRDLMPYRVTNKCINTTIRFRQYTDQGVLEWITVPPYSSLPWAYEHPLLKGSVELDINQRADNKFEKRLLCKLDEDEDVATTQISTSDGQRANVYVYVHEDGPTKELIVSGYPNIDKIINTKQANKQQQLALLRTQRLKELLPCQAIVAEQVQKIQARRKRNYHAYAVQQRGQIKRPDGLPDQQSYLLIRVTGVRHLTATSPYFMITYGTRSVKSKVMDLNNISYEALIPAGDVTDTSSCTIELRDAAHPLPDKPVGYIKFLVTELQSHAPQHSWQKLHVLPGTHTHTRVGELELLLWWIPASTSLLEKQLHTDNILYSEKKRILTSIQSEINAINQLTDPNNVITGNNEYTFLVSLWSVHGLRPLLAPLPDGKIVCHLHSLNTGKQASVLIASHNDDTITDGAFEW